MGCKTVIVYSPHDLSCRWEANQFGEGKGQLAFRLGGNIITYATGLELPKPRLSEVEIVRKSTGPKPPPDFLQDWTASNVSRMPSPAHKVWPAEYQVAGDFKTDVIPANAMAASPTAVLCVSRPTKTPTESMTSGTTAKVAGPRTSGSFAIVPACLTSNQVSNRHVGTIWAL